MGRYAWSRRSLVRLEHVHPHLREWVDRLLAHPALPHDLTIPAYGGARTVAEQQWLLQQGRTQTMDSRHVVRPGQQYGLAVDVIPYVDGRSDPETWSRFRGLGHLGQLVAAQMGLPIVWGGHWDSIPDGAHWELSRHIYL